MIRAAWWLVPTLLATGWLLAQDPEAGDEEPTAKEDARRIETLDGKVYHDCRIVRSDAEALLVEHAGGMARISFFDLPPSLQEKHGFDPVEGLRLYRESMEEQRKLRRQRMLETERYRAILAEEEEKDRLKEQARRSWIPVEASIVKRLNDGILVEAQQIVFEETVEISTLGFERPGPPRRTLQPFAEGRIFLQLRPDFPLPAPELRRWIGYVEPFSSVRPSENAEVDPKIPIYRAVPR